MSWIELVASQLPGMQIQGKRTPPKDGDPPIGDGSWYRIENSAEDTADVYVYDAIGGWDGLSAENFVTDLRGVTAKNINLRVNSPGGSVFDGITIANALRSHPAKVTTYVDGLAASIASVIALAGDRVVMMPQSQLMIHDASGMCYGNQADMAEMAALLDKQSDNIARAYALRAGGTPEQWRDVMKAETWYLDDEAVAAGLADEVMTPAPSQGAVEDDADMAARTQRPAYAFLSNSWDLSVFTYAGRDNAPDPVNIARVKEAIAELEPDPVKPATPVVVDVKLDSELIASHLADALRTAIKTEVKAQIPTPPEPVKPNRTKRIVNVMRQFDEGDTVAVIGTPHEPGHSTGVVAVVNGNAYGIIFTTPDDDTEPGEPYLWYVDDELQFVKEGPDGGGSGDSDGDSYSDTDGDGDGATSPGYSTGPDRPILPGVSHPHGVPNSSTDDWSLLTSGLFNPAPQPSSADEVLKSLREAL